MKVLVDSAGLYTLTLRADKYLIFPIQLSGSSLWRLTGRKERACCPALFFLCKYFGQADHVSNPPKKLLLPIGHPSNWIIIDRAAGKPNQILISLVTLFGELGQEPLSSSSYYLSICPMSFQNKVGRKIVRHVCIQRARKLKKNPGKKLVKSYKSISRNFFFALLAVLNFFPVQNLIFGHF